MWKQIQKKYLGATVPVINVHGSITADCTQQVAKRLQKLSTSTAVALAVSVNSAGGLPVQSQIICNKIREFGLKNNLKVHTFAKDLAASGGYFVLCCGNHVVADRTSLVGNIGVIFPKYRLDGLLDMGSLHHKQITSNKQMLAAALNPFHDMTEEEKAEILKTCGWTHEKFIKHVKKFRGSKITDDGSVFNGQIYSGEEALKVGLIDEVGSMMDVLDKLYPGFKLEVEKTESWGKTLFG